ncbi:MAG TPA: DEAD/DEAH box helicase, partial [Candidatus Acetothermia bacterium]|nr:DEAD/DEAH box helicase [Candidatus Acetothermia bacterium]
MALVWVLVISHHSVGGRRVEGLGVLELFHPIVAQWFRGAFGRPTPPQALGWPPIAKGEHTLILAPTGSGKTLAAFLYAIDELIRRPQGEPPPGVHILYISPLKALGYDIERNLQVPLAGIREVAIAQGIELPDIRVGVRTGDTSSSERQTLVRRPPHILITTPESLHLMLTSPRARETLRTVRYVIVDEIHALAPNKRGTFLSVLLERLEDLCGRPFQRIGLSATIRPLTKVARFLGGYRREDGELSERAVRVVDAGMRKKLDIKILAPLPDMTALPEGTIWPAIYQRLLELIQSHRSTIVFTGSRRAAERITAELNELAGYEVARVHHGSVVKEVRRELEQQLKAGELPALVATASLELGIDMGLVDLVCQVESPRSVARALQRVGRAGHVFCAASKGRLIPKTRADLLEIAAVAWGMRKADIAPVRIPENPLDILAQQIVAIVAAGPIPTKEVYRLLRRAYPYRDLPEDSFRKVVEMLA